MDTKHSHSRRVTSWLRRNWVFLTVAGFAMLLVLAGRPAWAADGRHDIGQTVPPPTPRPEPPAPGQPTPAPDDDDDGGGQSEAAPSAPAPQADTASGGAGAVPPGAAPGTAETGTVTTVVLNVRAGPGTDFAVLGKLNSGDRVTILNRNPAGDWLNVCCVPGTQTQGWVSAQYVALEPVAQAVQLPTPTPGAAGAAPAATPAAAGAATGVTTTAVISVTGQQQPLLAWQSLPITLVFTIEVGAASPASEVRFRYEVPTGLTLIAVDNQEGKSVTDKTDAGRDRITVSWPSLGARATERVTVRLLLSEDVPNGAVIDSLVAVTSRNGGKASAAVVTALPPAAPPDFQ